MDVVLVVVRAYDDLVTRQTFLVKLLRKPQRQLRRNLIGFERLNDMIILHAAYFPDLLFRRHHLLIRPSGVTVVPHVFGFDAPRRYRRIVYHPKRQRKFPIPSEIGNFRVLIE